MTGDPARRERLRERAGELPAAAGVYLFRNGDGEILYVGKAKSLRSRVRSYLTADARRPVKLHELVRRIDSFETFVLDSEAEALLLEWNLIKEHSPRFNIQLRDDKSYPYVKVTVAEPFPRVLVTRQLERDGSRYFGPFTDVGGMRSALRMVKKIYKVRSCHYDMPRELPERPCLDYHIGRCRAPCAGYQSREDYRRRIDEILQVLAGRTDRVKKGVRERMEEAAAELDFERAAELRDTLGGLEALERRRTPVDFRGGDRDVVGLARRENLACGVVLRVREGRLLGREVHYLRNLDVEEAGSAVSNGRPADSPPGGGGREVGSGIVGALIKGFYLRQEDLPPELLVPREFEDRDLVEEHLSLRRDAPFAIHVPHRGRKRRLIELAEENAEHLLRREGPGPAADGGEASSGEVAGDLSPSGPAGRSSLALAGHLALESPPRSLVCFDVSTLQGADSAGSAVWLEDGRPEKSEYRRFRIRETPEGESDDYAMMQEIVGRYFHRRVREGDRLPDLVVIDGGPGQLAAAGQGMDSAGVSDLPTIALAKREEEIFRPGEREPLRIPTEDPALHWLQRARNEAHRFALSYNRTLRRRRTLRSRLSEISGVGPTREQVLLRHFGSLAAVRAATVEELAATPGIGPTTADRIRAALSDGSGQEALPRSGDGASGGP